MSSQTLYFSFTATPLGKFIIARSDKGLCRIALGASSKQLISDLKLQFPNHCLSEDNLAVKSIQQKFETLVQKPDSFFELPLDIRGTLFQTKVWQALRNIPCGETRSYSQIAEKIGKREASRAVARACAANQLALVIPCHRVIRRDGTLGGYRWGIATKRLLLHREQLHCGKYPP